MVSVIAVLTGRIQQMKFMPGKSDNPEPRKTDVLEDFLVG